MALKKVPIIYSHLWGGNTLATFFFPPSEKKILIFNFKRGRESVVRDTEHVFLKFGINIKKKRGEKQKRGTVASNQRLAIAHYYRKKEDPLSLVSSISPEEGKKTGLLKPLKRKKVTFV